MSSISLSVCIGNIMPCVFNVVGKMTMIGRKSDLRLKGKKIDQLENGKTSANCNFIKSIEALKIKTVC